jgi:hypothetical protein
MQKAQIEVVRSLPGGISVHFERGLHYVYLGLSACTHELIQRSGRELGSLPYYVGVHFKD